MATLNRDFGGYIHVADYSTSLYWVTAFCGVVVHEDATAEPERADCPVCLYRLDRRAERQPGKKDGGGPRPV